MRELNNNCYGANKMINRNQEKILSPAEAGQVWTKAAAYLAEVGSEYMTNFLMEAYLYNPEVLENLKSAIISLEEGLADIAEDE